MTAKELKDQEVGEAIERLRATVDAESQIYGGLAPIAKDLLAGPAVDVMQEAKKLFDNLDGEQ